MINKPDPWPPEIDKEIRKPEAICVCHRCFTPQETATWFCPDCGTAVGPYNNTMPFIRIFSMGEVVRSAVNKNAWSTPLRIIGYFITGFLAYSLFFPFYAFRLIWNFAKKNTSDNDEIRSYYETKERRFLVIAILISFLLYLNLLSMIFPFFLHKENNSPKPCAGRVHTRTINIGL